MLCAVGCLLLESVSKQDNPPKGMPTGQAALDSSLIETLGCGKMTIKIQTSYTVLLGVDGYEADAEAQHMRDGNGALADLEKIAKLSKHQTFQRAWAKPQWSG